MVERGSCPSYVREVECLKLCCGMDDEPVKSLWIKIRGQTSISNSVGVCYRCLVQEEVEDEAFFRQLKAASCLQALVLMWTA